MSGSTPEAPLNYLLTGDGEIGEIVLMGFCLITQIPITSVMGFLMRLEILKNNENRIKFCLTLCNKQKEMELILLGIIVLLAFVLSSPNLIYLIHKKWFKWRDDKTDYIQGAKDYCESPLPLKQFLERIK